ncbi:MAG: RNA methyltransferase [Ignavibacteria bacterium GWB2_35_12]|nr:MAG: RNA methyltransferase [Ignavibacteria bacterium GWA2_35_8]OGU42177.1 MAG: RNA methyltransferase [Ignavibacteria bacterium GWB2_35_12]OGU92911.1 MAG: RNA methyltransferase [Ignavibacteria bacterium RIFOXYA2_FULL_35_10]OGV18688.1 MAG: RNA methyltransferase [Ignavibacteria bacterium RIFOXYC2_FULL_35_21]
MKPQLFHTEQRIKRLKDVLSKRQTTLTVVLENINDPHNLSAALRSCDAVGIYEVCLVYYGGQPFPKLGAKSSASARKWIHIRKYKSVEDCFAELRKEDKKIYTTHMSKESVSLYDLKLTQPTALVFGNEHSGVSEEAVNLADGNFLIPQVGIIQSLNISVAVAVSVYEAFRQRCEAGMYDKPQFKKVELNKLLEEWGKK